MKRHASFSAILVASLALWVAPAPSLAGVSAPYLNARDTAPAVIFVSNLGPDNTQYRQWLLKRSKRNSQAAKALDFLERRRRSGSLNSEEQKILDDFHAEFSTERENRFRAYLRQKVLKNAKAGVVLDYENGKGKPKDMPDVEFDLLYKKLVDDFKEERERETDFVAWVRKQTNRTDHLGIAATAVVAQEDGEAPAENTNESDDADARQLLLKVYNENKKEFVKKYVKARDDVKTALDALVSSVKVRRKGGRTAGQGVLLVDADAKEAIHAAIDDLDDVEDEGEAEFGSTSWRNILGANSDAVEEQDTGLIMQSKVEGYCGQCAVEILGDTGNIDELMADDDFQKVGTNSVDLIRYLGSRGFDAGSVAFDADDRLAMSKVDRLVMRRQAIDGALAGTEFPIIISIDNEDDFLSHLQVLDAYNNETAVIGADGSAEAGLMETVMGAELWNRLKEVKSRSSYSHWIVLSNINQINNRSSAHILDPDAGVYETPLERIVNAKRFEIVFINPTQPDAPQNSE